MERSVSRKMMGNDKFSVNYRRDCALAEKEALKTLCSVHMPVINIPSTRDITLANYKRRMMKCDKKIRETGIVLVATTDFVAACLSCPPLFGWNIDDSKEQVSALLADLGLRWTRLLSVDQSRRSMLLSLLETSLRCLDEKHLAHFHEAREVGKQPAVSKEDTLGSPILALPTANTLGSPILALPKAETLDSQILALPKVDTFSSPILALSKPNTLGSPIPVLPKAQGSVTPLQRTLVSFFAKTSGTKVVAAGDEDQTPPPTVFTANQAQLQIGQGEEAPPPMPLVNTTNLAKQTSTPSVAKTATNALLVMMNAAKENKRKNDANGRLGPDKRVRKGRTRPAAAVITIAMEGESNPMRALCRSGCGFFSNPSMDGLCSLCYKEALKKKQQPPNQVPFEGAASSADPEATGEVETALPTVSTPEKEVEAASSSDGAKGGKDAKDGKKKNRCASCRKKVGLTGFDCRCGGLYCAVHRYSDKHACTFNYRETGAQEIRRNNPVVVSEKIQKI